MVEPSLSLPRLFFSLRFCSSCFEYAQPTSPIGPRTACSSPAATPPPELRVVPAPAPESAADCDCGPGFRAGQSAQMLDELLAPGTRSCCGPRSVGCGDARRDVARRQLRSGRGVHRGAGHRRCACALASVERTAALALLLASGAVLPESAGSYRTDQLLGETDRGSRVRVMMVVVAVHPFGWVR